MSKITFYNDGHKYVLEDGRPMLSVSSFVDSFKEKVDWDKKAANVAKKLTREGTPTTMEDVKKMWENKRNISASVGTLLHSIEEERSLSLGKEIICGVECIVRNIPRGDVKDSIAIHNLDDQSIYPELMIYDLDSMICGQSDKVIIADNYIHIYDYKTDKEISFKGYSSKWESAKCYLPPISHLEECNGNSYSLKMSMYMYMLWKANKGRLRPGKIVIIHKKLQRDENDIPILIDGLPVVKEEVEIELPYRKKEVMDMLKTRQ